MITNRGLAATIAGRGCIVFVVAGNPGPLGVIARERAAVVRMARRDSPGPVIDRAAMAFAGSVGAGTGGFV